MYTRDFVLEIPILKFGISALKPTRKDPLETISELSSLILGHYFPTILD